MNRAAEYRKQFEQKTKQEPTAEVRLPSGNTFTLRRPPLLLWTMSGKIPQHFARKIQKQVEQGVDPTKNLSEEEAFIAIKFMRDVVLYACVSPIVKSDPAPDEDAIDPGDFIPGDFEFIFQWATNQAPDVPVLIEGGQTSVTALESFRNEGRGSGAAGHRPYGAEVWAEAEPTATPV